MRGRPSIGVYILMRTFVLLLTLTMTSLLSGQVYLAKYNALNVVFGTTLQSKSAGIGRVSVGYTPLKTSKLGVYYRWERTSGLVPTQNPNTSDQITSRDILGGSYFLNRNFQLNMGVGLIKPSGIIQTKGLSGLRKEMVLNYTNWDHGFVLGLGYSFSVGATANFGIVIPVNKTVDLDPRFW